MNIVEINNETEEWNDKKASLGDETLFFSHLNSAPP